MCSKITGKTFDFKDHTLYTTEELLLISNNRFNEILIQTGDRARLRSGAKTDIQKGLTMSFLELDFLTSLGCQPRDDGLMSSHKQLKIDGCCSLVAQSSNLQILFIIIVNLNLHYYHRITAMGDNK